jgi:hypothetical protein
MDADGQGFGGSRTEVGLAGSGQSEWGLLPAQIINNDKNTPLLPRPSGYYYGGKLPLCERFNDRAQMTFMDEFQTDYLGIPWLSFNVNHPRTARGIVNIQ